MSVSTNKKFIEWLVQNSKIKTKAIINAFFKIDRINFVPDEFRGETYFDIPVPIFSGMTTSQPSTIAFMLEKLSVAFTGDIYFCFDGGILNHKTVGIIASNGLLHDHIKKIITN